MVSFDAIVKSRHVSSDVQALQSRLDFILRSARERGNVQVIAPRQFESRLDPLYLRPSMDQGNMPGRYPSQLFSTYSFTSPVKVFGSPSGSMRLG